MENPNIYASKDDSFALLPNIGDTWDKVLKYGHKIERPKGHCLVHSGQKCESLYYLEKGEVQLVRNLPDGKQRVLWISTPPSLVGESPFFSNTPILSSMEITKASTLYVFSQSWINNTLIPEYPDIVLSILQNLAKKIIMMTHQSVELSTKDMRTTICHFLHQKLHVSATENFAITGLTQQAFANLLGVHRTTLHKHLRALENDGIIGPYSKNRTYILDLQRFYGIIA